MSSSGQPPREYKDEYIGQVTSVADPKKMMRVQVRVSPMFDGANAADLPWATYRLPLGSRVNDGSLCPVQVGDMVWVDFPFNGDTRRPRITGGVHYCPDGKPNLPADIFAGATDVVHKRTAPQLTPDPAEYHQNFMFRQHGVLIEIIKATGAARITQVATGSAVEIDKDGSITVHSENNLYASAVNSAYVKVGQDAFVDVGKSAIVTAGTSVTINAPVANLNAGQINLTGNITTTGGGGAVGTETKRAVTTHTGSLSLTGPLSIDGDITCTGTIRGATVTGHLVES